MFWLARIRISGRQTGVLRCRENFLYSLPDRFNDETAAPLLCAGIIGYRSLRRSELPRGGRLGNTRLLKPDHVEVGAEMLAHQTERRRRRPRRERDRKPPDRAHPVGVQPCGLPRDVSAPVMPDHGPLIRPSVVKQPEHIAREDVDRVLLDSSRGVRVSIAAEIGHKQPVARGRERPDLVAP